MVNKYIAEFLGTLLFFYVILVSNDPVVIGAALVLSYMVVNSISQLQLNHNPGVTIMLTAAGKHVLLEKPMALRTSDAKEMVDLANEKGLLLFVVKQNRFNPSSFNYYKMPNVTMTPHISAWSEGMIKRRSIIISENINRLYKSKKLLNEIKY